MGLFSRKKPTNTGLLDTPRYKENPMNIFFENLVLDTIGKLPAERAEQLDSMNLAKVFKTDSKDWKLIIKQVLNLSDTIEIAILDLWYRNREIASKQGIEYEPIHFAMDFVDNYYKDDSKVDVWTASTLEEAKLRIESIRQDER